jgi:hypothetical protein
MSSGGQFAAIRRAGQEDFRKSAQDFQSPAESPAFWCSSLGSHEVHIEGQGFVAGKAGGSVSVLLLTVFVSLMLALFFAGCFLYHHDFSGGDPMRDSLLPFNKENTKPAEAGKDAEKKHLP